MQSDTILTRVFILAWFASLFDGLGWSLYLHFSGFLQDLGADEIQIGLIIGVASISSLLVRPWVGNSLDRRGRRPVILVGNLVNVIALALYLTVSTIGPWVYVVRIIHGVSLGLLFTAFFTYAADIVPEGRRTQGLAVFGVSGLLPLALGGLIGDIVLSIWDFTALFVTALAFGIAAFVLSLLLKEPTVIGADSDRSAQGFFRAIIQPSLLPLWWISAVFATVLTAYFTFMRTFVDETGVGTVGLFFGTYAGTAILMRLLFGWLPDRVGRLRVFYPAVVLYSIGFLVLAFASSPIHIVIAGIFSGIGHGFGFPILLGLVVDRSPAPDRGSTIAFFTALFDVGLLIGGPLLGAIISGSGYPAMFVTAAIITLAGLGVYGWWDKRWSAGSLPAADA